MPFTSQEIQRAGKAALDFYAKNNPVDQVDVERPWMHKLFKGKKSFPGGKQYIVEQLRYRYQSNFQWYYGDQQVSYNKRATIEQAQYQWRSCHDGYSLNEDEFLQNGITVADNHPRTNTEAEMLQLTDIFEENNEVLRLGFMEKFDESLLRDGTADADAIEGLDALITLDAGDTVGSIDSSANTWWENYRSLGVAQGSLITTMETAWRNCIRNGGAPNFIMAGSDFVDDFRAAAKSEISKYTIVRTTGGQAGLDPSTGPVQGINTGLHFQQIPIYWNPVFENLDAIETGLASNKKWEKRCYMINCKYIRLRPAKGHDMVTRTPPRVYDRYAYYWGLTWKGGLCTSRRNAHAVITID